MIWEMAGQRVRGQPQSSDGPITWQVAGTGDFDSDGDDDILWHHEEGPSRSGRWRTTRMW